MRMSNRASHGTRVMAAAALLAALAAAAGYAAHHAPPLAPHTAASVAIVVAVSAGVSLAALVLAAGRRHAPLAPVVVAAPGSTEVRRAEREHVGFCAALHAQTLPHGFFVSLGPRFLRAYYRTFLDSQHAIARVAMAGEHPIGMVVGVTAPRAHTRRLLRRHGLRLAFVGCAALLTRPLVGVRFARTRLGRYVDAWRRHRREEGPPPATEQPIRQAAILSHIAVVPGAQRAGVGRELVDAFVHAARRSGAGRIVLLTLEGDEGAGPFYAARGWAPGPARPTPDGQTMREWTLDL